MIKMPFLPLNNLNDINCGHVRKCVMLSIIFYIIFIRFGSKLYRQIAGIPIGTNCAPLVADLFLFCYERDDALAVCWAHRGLPVGFLLLLYSVLFTVESLSLLYLLVIS